MIGPSRIPTPSHSSRSFQLHTILLTIPFLVLAGWLVGITLHASLPVDHVRHFYLDDEQMISMRYARNLVEGYGLVWNRGERVEAYLSLGWVLVMAAVHAAGAAPQSASLYVKLAAAMCAGGVLWHALALRRRLGSSTPWGEVVLLLALALSADVVFWAANGFETTLLTVVFLWLMVRVLAETEAGAPSAATLFASGVLPVIRSDAHPLALAVLAIAIALCPATHRRHALRLALLAGVLPLLQVLFRVAYYGDVFPNTFYLRHAAVDNVWLDGARYVRSFVRSYWIPLGAAVMGALSSGDRRQRWLLAAMAAAAAQALAGGGDMYAHFRVFAPIVPIMVVLAVAAVERWTETARLRRAAGLVLVAGAAIWSGGIATSWSLDSLRSWRGKPWDGIVLGILIDRHTSPTATVAAADVGAFGYFSRRTVIDLTGRTDPVIGRGPSRQGADPAARKFDIAFSLGRTPDVVLTGGPHAAAQLGEIMIALHGVDTTRDIGPALLADRTFLRNYRDFPVPLPPLLERSAVYVRRDSPERSTLAGWTMPRAEF